eukprot:Rmarinus@m.18232
MLRAALLRTVRGRSFVGTRKPVFRNSSTAQNCEAPSKGPRIDYKQRLQRGVRPKQTIKQKLLTWSFCAAICACVGYVNSWVLFPEWYAKTEAVEAEVDSDQKKKGSRFTTTVGLPGLSWGLKIDLAGNFELLSRAHLAHGKGVYLLLTNEETGCVVGVHILEGVQGHGIGDPNDPTLARDFFWQRESDENFPRTDVRFWEIPFQGRKAAYSEYVSTERRAPTLYRVWEGKSKVCHAYYNRDRVWVDVHVAKSAYANVDDELLAKCLTSVHFVEDYAMTPQDCFDYANATFHHGDLASAMEFFERAYLLNEDCALEDKLDENSWKILVGNYAILCVWVEDFSKARALLHRGVDRFGYYAGFRYNLAELCARDEEWDSVLEHLEVALRHPESLLNVSSVPDARADPSFRALLEKAPEHVISQIDALYTQFARNEEAQTQAVAEENGSDPRCTEETTASDEN